MKKISFIVLLFMGLQASASNLKVWMNNPTIMADGKTVAYLTVYQTDIANVETKECDLYSMFAVSINVPDGITLALNDKGKNDVTLNEARFGDLTENVLSSNQQSNVLLKVATMNTSADETILQFDGEGNVLEELFTIGLIADETMETGSYEISLSEVKFVHVDATANVPAETVTAALSVVPEGSIRTILDENSTTLPTAAENVNIQVYRTLVPDVWNTICLPFAMSEAQVKAAFGDDVKLSDFTGYDAEEDADENIVGIEVNFTDVTEIEANHPYIIKVSSAISDFTVDGVNIDPEEEPTNATVKRTKKAWSEMKGTYIAQTEIPNLCLYLSGNDFWYSTGLTKMKAFRAYFDFYDVLTDVEDTYSVKMFIHHAGGETEIEEVQTFNVSNVQDGEIYDLAGRRVEKAGKGIYIINNKKVLVR